LELLPSGCFYLVIFPGEINPVTDLLVITTLYPNPVQQRHGIFVETRLRHLISDGSVTATVIAPVPWFPFNSSAFPEYSNYRKIPRTETRNAVEVHHPRYLVIPRIGMLLTPFFMALSLFFSVRKLRKNGGRFDVVDAHYYYPDGVAVALISRYLGKPFLVTARGTDINLIPQYAMPRRLILWAAKKAAASITVCQALKDAMVELGAAPEKIHVMRNGVDLQLFRPLNRDRCRKKYALSRTTLLSVGHLIERKGHNLVIDALRYLPDIDLLIAGDGEEEANLRAQVARLNLGDRVTFLGAVGQQELAEVYSAVDAMVLASSREGWANVLLESMACGTPVVATSIWGTPEVVTDPVAGVLVEQRSGQSLADGVSQLLANYPLREATRAYAETFSWDDTITGIKQLLSVVQRDAGLKNELSVG
jgi:teichuronic acid biosynthesis glycosyltransferase TuaC